MADRLLPLPLTANTVHLCIDMQRMFSVDGPWPTPWMDRVLPVVAELAGRFPERAVFTRFITPKRPEDMPGMWQADRDDGRRDDPGELALTPSFTSPQKKTGAHLDMKPSRDYSIRFSAAHAYRCIAAKLKEVAASSDGEIECHVEQVWSRVRSRPSRNASIR